MGPGPGRVDTFTPAKALFNFRFNRMPRRELIGPADMPSTLNLNKYQPNMVLNWDGATQAARSVIIDSALGIVVKPGDGFLEQMD